MSNCPRCGYPDLGPRVGSLVALASICAPCAQVEAMEIAQLGRALPLERWAVNDR